MGNSVSLLVREKKIMTEEQPVDDKIADDIEDFMKGLKDTLKCDEVDVVDDLP